MRACGFSVFCISGLTTLLSIVFGATSAAAAQAPSAILEPVPTPVGVSPKPGASPANISVGGDVSPGSRAAYAGATFALNADLSQDGFLVRTSFAIGEYEGRRTSDDRSDVSFQNANVMVGYQHDLGGARVAFFVGADFTYNGAGASDNVRGSSWGLRGIVDVVVPVSRDLDVSAWGTYSTIESQYYVQGRALYRLTPNIGVGPQIALLGGDTWARTRVGGHAAVNFGRIALGVGAGHEWKGGGGQYGSAILSFLL